MKKIDVKPVFKIYKDGERIPYMQDDHETGNRKKSHDQPNDDAMLTSIKQEMMTPYLIRKANSKLEELSTKKMKREKRTKLTVYACFLSIENIENIKQRFKAEVYIETQWEDNTVVESAFDPKKYWTPDLFIENTIQIQKETITYKLIKKNNKTIVIETRKVIGIFYETLELYDFPLDIQDVSISLTTTRSENEIEFEISNQNESTVNTGGFRMGQEWTIYGFVNSIKKEYNDVFRNYKRPAMSFQGKIVRRAGYYINNAYILMFLITGLGFMPFAFTVSAASARIGSTITLILSSINFKINVTSRIPTISYFTILDIYCIPALVYLAILCFYHAIISSPMLSSVGASKLSIIDSYCFYGFVGIFAGFHIFYLILFVYKLSKHKKVKKDEDCESHPKQDNKNSLNKTNKKENKINDASFISLSKLESQVTLVSGMKKTKTNKY